MGPDLRIGSGWDSHAFVPGRPLRLGGIDIAHPSGLAGHSDGDVLLHAVCDALLGAIGAGDIGSHFPSSDERFRGADSSTFVRHALQLVEAAGWEIVNLDATVILLSPRLGPYATRLRENVAALLGTSGSRVSIKAKTPEGLDLPETAMAQVVILLRYKQP
jgi:2-C-methyl-D-erythritol 2,4-cyclodiphosphate synthase